MALRDPLQASTVDALVRLLNGRFRDLAEQLDWPMVAKGRWFKDQKISGLTTIQPGHGPGSWTASRVRSATVTAVVETSWTDKGLVLMSATDCVVDLWVVP